MTVREQRLGQVVPDEGMTTALAVDDERVVSTDLDRQAPAGRGERPAGTDGFQASLHHPWIIIVSLVTGQYIVGSRMPWIEVQNLI